MIKNKKVIIWDWNGTLLDDAQMCVDCMNIVLSQRKISSLSLAQYRDIFTFPVRDYYIKAGFDFENESFEVPAMEFISLYYDNLHTVGLFPAVHDVLKFFQNKGLQQLVLSAMQHDSLVQSLNEKGIINYFQKVSGITDHFAHSKLEIGRDLLNGESVNKDEVLLIGDTIHDFEVANQLGVDCVLVANGHQSKNRLLQQTAQVYDSLLEVVEIMD